MNVRLQIRNILMIFIGVIALLSKSWFRSSLGDLAHAYLGNLAASFAVFFVLALAAPPRLPRFWIAATALVIVQAFELTNGFGVMANVYDPYDYLANSLGVGLAYCVDFLIIRIVPSFSKGR